MNLETISNNKGRSATGIYSIDLTNRYNLFVEKIDKFFHGNENTTYNFIVDISLVSFEDLDIGPKSSGTTQSKRINLVCNLATTWDAAPKSCNIHNYAIHLHDNPDPLEKAVFGLQNITLKKRIY